MPRLVFTAGTFVVFENQTSVDITIARSGDLCGAGSFQLKTLQVLSETPAHGNNNSTMQL